MEIIKNMDKMDKYDFIKINVYHVEDTVKKMQRKTTDKGNIFAKHTSEKGLWIYNTYKDLLWLNNKRISNN